MRWTQARLMAFDTETTGIDVESDRVIELGAAYFDSGKPSNLRRALIDPQRPIPAEATEVHHISDEDIRGQPTFEALAPRIVGHFRGGADDNEAPRLVGYNALAFDVLVLNAEFHRAGVEYRIDPRMVLDLMIFVRWHHRDMRNRRLTRLCEHYGVPLRNAHSASADAAATGRLLFRLIEAGLVPDDVEEAMATQARYAELIEREWARWSYWLYADRENGELRIGAGKYCGTLLSRVDSGYIAYLVRKIDDLPEEVRQVFSATS